MEATGAAGFQDQFLNLLTTQLRHQDPLEPTKQEDFIAQLAQFSTLEGIEKLNDNFSTFMEAQNAALDSGSEANNDAQLFQNMAAAAGLVGSEVTFEEFTRVEHPDGTSSQNAESKSGTVDAIVLENDAVHLRIAGDLIKLDRLQEIGAGTPSTTN